MRFSAHGNANTAVAASLLLEYLVRSDNKMQLLLLCFDGVAQPVPSNVIKKESLLGLGGGTPAVQFAWICLRLDTAAKLKGSLGAAAARGDHLFFLSYDG